MDRRDFLKTSLSLGVAAAATTLLSKPMEILAQSTPNDLPDLVAIRGEDITKMFNEGMKAYGGISRVVKRGQTVLVKPNIGWDSPPEMAANTNPILVGRIVSACYEAGAKRVYVFDHTCNQWQRSYANSGIEATVKLANGVMVPANQEGYYQKVEIPNAQVLKSLKVHQTLLEADVIINVPVLKHHGSTRLTMAMKNLMGVVWDRSFYHSRGLHQAISEFPLYRKPDLNIVDAYLVVKNNGPQTRSKSDVVSMKSMLISNDIVAIDTAAAAYFNLKSTDIRHIQMANALGLGTSDLDKIKIRRMTV